MALLESLIGSSGKTERKPVGFTVTMVHYSKLIPSEDNNYSMDSIKELAQMIVLAGGVKQNLLARKKSPDTYELIAGHRRRQAVQYLVEELGKEEYAMLPVHVERDGDLISEVNLIITNCGARTRSDWERMMEVSRLTELLKAMQSGSQEEQERFRKWFDLEPRLSGRELRKLVAELTGMSETKVAQLNHINNNLVLEMMDKFKEGKIGVSVANETAGLPAQTQQGLASQESVKLSDVKAVSESDTPRKAPDITLESPKTMPKERISEIKTYESSEIVSESDTEKKPEKPCQNLTQDSQKPFERNEQLLDAMIKKQKSLLAQIDEYWSKELSDVYCEEMMKLEALEQYRCKMFPCQNLTQNSNNDRNL